MSKFVQILQSTPEFPNVWALDDEGYIWNCVRIGTEKLLWQRLESEKHGNETSPRTAQLEGAEKFRAAVLNHLRNIQNDPRSESAAHIRVIARQLLEQIESFDIPRRAGTEMTALPKRGRR